MNIGQVMEMLSLYNPKDDLLLITTTQKIGHITGINEELSRNKGCIVIKCEWDEVIKERETFKEGLDKQIQQLEDLKRMVDRKGLVQEVLELRGEAIEGKRKEVNEKQPKKKATKVGTKKMTRTFAQQLCDGFIPTGKKGRPRKINTERLSVDVRLLLKPDKIEDMTQTELIEFIKQINKEIRWKKL